MTSAGPQIIQETNITTEGGDRSLSACKSLVIYLRFHQNENLLKFDVLTTSHMRRTLARENFTSARRRRAISLSMLKVANINPRSTDPHYPQGPWATCEPVHRLPLRAALRATPKIKIKEKNKNKDFTYSLTVQ